METSRSLADTATAPRMQQNEHVQRRALQSPLDRFTVNRTAPQWQEPRIGPEESL